MTAFEVNFIGKKKFFGEGGSFCCLDAQTEVRDVTAFRLVVGLFSVPCSYYYVVSTYARVVSKKSRAARKKLCRAYGPIKGVSF